MELQIKDLVSSIKKDGIEAAQAEADAIIAAANEKAAKIIADAKDQAENIKTQAQNEIEILNESAKVTADHAKRDAMLAFKQSVQDEFEKLLLADAGKCLGGKELAELIKAALGDEDPANYLAEVAQVGDTLKSELADQIRNGLEIKPSKSVHAGFRLAAKDASGYFDCSDEEITAMLMPFFPDQI